MKESPRSPKLEQISLHEEDWTLHPAVEWMVNHKNYFFWVFLLIVLLLVFSLRWMTNKALDAERDYFQAQALYTQFESSIAAGENQSEEASGWENSFEKLQTILARRPELKPKYEGSLAQTFLALGDESQAKPLVADIFKRTGLEAFDLYKQFTDISLLIAQNKLEESIKSSQELQGVLAEKGFDAHPLLYLFNLFRLGVLYQEEKLFEEESQIWAAFESLTLSPELSKFVNEALQAGGVSLGQYIQERKATHSQSK